ELVALIVDHPAPRLMESAEEFAFLVEDRGRARHLGRDQGAEADLVAGDGGFPAEAVAAAAAVDRAVASDLERALQIVDDARSADRSRQPLALGARGLRRLRRDALERHVGLDR